MTDEERNQYGDAEMHIQEMIEDFRKIAEYTDAVEAVVADLLADAPEGVLVRNTLEKIYELAEVHI